MLMWFPCTFQSTDIWKYSIDPEVRMKAYSQAVLWPKMGYSYNELTTVRCTNISEVAFTFQQWNRRKLGRLPMTPAFQLMALSLSITNYASCLQCPVFGGRWQSYFVCSLPQCSRNQPLQFFHLLWGKGCQELERAWENASLRTFLSSMAIWISASHLFFNLVWLLHFTLLRISERMAVCHLNTSGFSSCVLVIYFHCQSRAWTAAYECRVFSDVKVKK